MKLVIFIPFFYKNILTLMLIVTILNFKKKKFGENVV
jgi:hypothetical protein